MRNFHALHLLLFLIIPTSSAIGQTPPPVFSASTAATAVQSTSVATDGVTVVGYDSSGRAITSDGPEGQFAHRPAAADTRTEQSVDRYGNRVLNVVTPQGVTAFSVDTVATAPWSSVLVSDAANNIVLHGVDWESTAINAFAADLGIPLAYPDWVQVQFNAPKTISEVRFFTVQDNYPAPVEPTATTRFSLYGVTDFEVQYWYDAPDVKKWVVVPDGVVVNNRNVMRSVQFPAVTTTKVRVVIKNALAFYSRVVELEAFNTSGVNVALAANGGIATASSTLNASFPTTGINNGDRKGLNWGNGGGWADATPDNTPKLAAATTTRTEDSLNVKVVHQNAFAKVTQTFNKTPPPTSLPPQGYPYSFGNEITEAKGKVFQAWLQKTNRGIEIWDNQGGSQLFGHDSSNRLYWVADANDYVIKIARDTQGRIIRLYLGDTGLLRFFYDANGLVAKEFIDRQTSKRIFRVERPSAERSKFSRTREALQAVLPGVGTIAEFDKTVDDRGLVVAHLLNQPYALIPFQHSGPLYNWHMPVRWIINLPPEDMEHDLVDRIEFNEDEIIVRLSTWREMPGTPRHVAAISMPRAAGGTMPTTFKSHSSRVPNIPGIAMAFSDGGAEGHEPDNDDVGGCDTDMCMTVIGEAPPDMPPFTSYPPSSGNGGGGAGAGNPNPFDASLSPMQRANMERAKAAAEKALTEKPECAALFSNLKNKNGRGMTTDWTKVRIYSVKNGESVVPPRGRTAPCSVDYRLLWMEGAGRNTIFVCQRAETEDSADLRDAYIHEMLHSAGLTEAPNTNSTLTHGEISQKVTAACQ